VEAFSRYMKLWFVMAKNCFIRQSEFKINLLGRLSIEFVWIAIQFIFFKSTFRFVTKLGSWSESDIWFFVASLIFADGLFMLLIQDNLARFGQIIRLGLLDFYLLYPASSLFLSTFRFVNVISFVNMTCAIAILFWLHFKEHLAIGIMGWMIWAFYTLVGVVLIGIFAVLVSSVAFWTTQSSNLIWLFYELYRLGHRPEDLYSKWMRRLLLSVFPAAFFISIPVQLALGKLTGIAWYLAPLMVLTFLLLIVRRVWSNGVKRYEGAMG
jgi:ABC-2 type transport system permease protein